MIRNKIYLYFFISLLFCIPVYSTTGNTQLFNDNDDDECDSIDYDKTNINDSLLVWPQNKCKELEALMMDKLLETSLASVVVYDLTADSLIFKHNEKQLMRPASTQKLITAITALDVLGCNYEISTELYYSGEIINGVLHGDVFCKGGFDVTFKTRDLNNFIRALKEEGIDTIKGNLFADKSFKDGVLLGEGWCWDDDNPTLSALLINEKDDFIHIFRRKLQENGVYIDGENKEGRLIRGAKLVYKKTILLSDLLPKMMKNSDNLYAECMFYHISSKYSEQANSKSSKKGVNLMIERMGLNSSDYRVADGSGLSLYNYTTANLETKFLIYAYRNKEIYECLKPSLPIAGIDGTLKKRMKTSQAKGKVFAKTGTVEGVSALAGYCVAANGHILCFSIINNGLIASSKGRSFQNKVCDILCR